MLLQFTVENFLSFNEKQVFSMRASRDKDHPRHVIGGKIPVVRGAAIYGANAAGKSNLVKAMGFARDLIVQKGRNSASIADLRPFKLTGFNQRPCSFHWHFLHAGKVWSYGFDITDRLIVEEYLYAQNESGGREKKWFERKTDEHGQSTVSFGDDFLRDRTSEDTQLAKLLGRRTPKDKLFLRHCVDNQIQIIMPVIRWFEEILLIVQAESNYEPLLLEANEDKSFLRFISSHLRDAGTGISELVAMSGEFEEKGAQYLNGEIPLTDHHSVNDAIEKLRAGESVVFDSYFGMWNKIQCVAQVDESGELRFKTLFTHHFDKTGVAHEFDLSEESEGTQRLLHLLPHFYRLQTRPTVLVIDELERRLHTLLTRRLVDQALNVTPIERSQFIFTTHDTNLLDSNLLRRDEIWFVDKNEQGASTLTSLAEYKIRPDVDYEKGYLLGRFDGIPYFRHSGELSEALQEDK